MAEWSKEAAVERSLKGPEEGSIEEGLEGIKRPREEPRDGSRKESAPKRELECA